MEGIHVDRNENYEKMNVQYRSRVSRHQQCKQHGGKRFVSHRDTV